MSLGYWRIDTSIIISVIFINLMYDYKLFKLITYNRSGEAVTDYWDIGFDGRCLFTGQCAVL
jgi:hypothetical protein